MLRFRWLLPAVLLLLGFPVGGSTQSPFVRIDLPKGVSLELPENWTIISENQRITLDASVRSRLDLSGVEYEGSDLPLAANFYDDSGRAIALMNVRYYPAMDISQEDIRSATDGDLREIDGVLEEVVRQGVEQTGNEITAWLGTTKQRIGGLHVLISEYRRESAVSSGLWRVRLARVLAEERSFTLTASYTQGREYLVEPITDRIISSIKLAGYDRIPGSGSEPSRTLASQIAEGNENLGLFLAFSFALTWGIGLTPPLLLRFALLRRPIGKWPAIGVVASLWVLNLILFTALGSQSRTHSALVLVALVSYWILRKGSANEEVVKDGEGSEERSTSRGRASGLS